MARRGFIAIFTPEPDTRTPGSLRFADPSKAAFTRDIHMSPEPHGENSVGSCPRITSHTGELVSWSDRRVVDTWAEMNRKRGVHDEEDE